MINRIKIIKAGVLSFLFITAFISCKKSELSVETEKHFVDLNHVPTFEYDGAFSVTLYPDGKAGMLPSGDIILSGTYKIKGAKLIVYIPDFRTTEFDIISKKELRLKDSSRILTLVD